jgi:hypothetical protein
MRIHKIKIKFVFFLLYSELMIILYKHSISSLHRFWPLNLVEPQYADQRMKEEERDN